MATRPSRKSKASQPKRRRSQAEGPGWQLWTVLAGIALIVLYLGSVLARDDGTRGSRYEGRVVAKESLKRPGELDSRRLRQLVLEQEDGSLMKVEVDKDLFDKVDSGFRVRRSPEEGIEAFDRRGEKIELTPFADAPQ